MMTPATETLERPKIAFFSSARHRAPLDATDEKKFRLLKRVCEPFVIAFSDDVRPHRFTEHARFYLAPTLRPAPLRYLELFLVGLLLGAWLALRRGVRVFVAQGPFEAMAAACIKRAARVVGQKVVLVVESHGDFEQSVFLQRRVRFAGLYRAAMNLCGRFVMRQADLLRAVSTSTRKQLERWAPGKPVFQFFTWTDIDAFAAAGAERSPTVASRRVLYAGVLVPRKGVHHLIGAFAQAAREFTDARLTIVGAPDNPAYASRLHELVAEKRLGERVEFVARVSQRELAKQMSQADVFVLPSASEGLPRVVFEAMAAGLPVVASRVDGIPDMITDGVNGLLVPAGDEQAIASSLLRLLEAPQEAREMGRRARGLACGQFSVEAYLASYDRLLRSAARLLEVGALGGEPAAVTPDCK